MLKPNYILFLYLNTCSLLSQNKKTLVDFFEPIPSFCSPAKYTNTWGSPNVIYRDTLNGLEDTQLKNWCYWDGNIVKENDKKYHMYASRWSQSFRHSLGWKKDSKAIHAVSNNLYGPYNDKGIIWPQWKQGKSANTIGLKMHDGRYAVVASEIVPGQIFVSDTPDGPFKLLGAFKIDSNGFYSGWGRYNELDDGAVKGGGIGNLANVMIINRPDGKYMMIARHCVTLISESGILGPYKMMSDKAWLDVEGIPQFKMEDPTVWYSDGLYHMVVNHYEKDDTYHLTSEDGITNWKNRGIAYHKDKHIFKYTNGNVENWSTVQRPTVYLENQIIKAFNFSVIDVHKGKDKANDRHGSKIMVVPFDGKKYNTYIKKIIKKEHNRIAKTSFPTNWKSTLLGSKKKAIRKGYDKETKTFRINTWGNNLQDKHDYCKFIYQKMTGDFSMKVQVLSDDISKNKGAYGLMVRQNLNSNSVALATMIFSKQGKLNVLLRNQENKNMEITDFHELKAPYWIRIEKKGNLLSSFISSSNRLNWSKVDESTLNLKDEFFVGMAATSLGNDSGIARFKKIDLHSYGQPNKDGIVNHTFPDKITSTGKISFEVELESKQTLDIWVELQNVQTLEKYKVLRKRFWQSGKHLLEYDAGKQLDPKASYWFVIKAIPMHFHDSQHIQSYFKKITIED